ncbi:MAG: hypothetical protein P4L45_02285 [Ignavibacteriaceae bacterium]|nr:hypothetical protein [Ignavibacteriaceae bacterium]
MSRVLVLIIVVIGVVLNVYPQESSFYDAPLGGGIGYTPGWVMPKVDGINTQLRNINFPNIPSSGFYSSGVSGFLYLGILKNFRIGGFGFGGSKSNSGIYTVDPLGSSSIAPQLEQRQTDYSLTGGGVSFEYTLPFVKDVAVSVGTLLGRGSLNISIYRNNGGAEWQSVWQGVYSSPVSSFSMKNSYWLFSPILNIEIPAYRMLCFRIGAGYQFTFGGNWTYDNDKDVSNVPSNINGNSFFIQTGIFIGLFSF